MKLSLKNPFSRPAMACAFPQPISSPVGGSIIMIEDIGF